MHTSQMKRVCYYQPMLLAVVSMPFKDDKMKTVVVAQLFYDSLGLILQYGYWVQNNKQKTKSIHHITKAVQLIKRSHHGKPWKAVA